jgi:hypothetical protein
VCRLKGWTRAWKPQPLCSPAGAAPPGGQARRVRPRGPVAVGGQSARPGQGGLRDGTRQELTGRFPAQKKAGGCILVMPPPAFFMAMFALSVESVFADREGLTTSKRGTKRHSDKAWKAPPPRTASLTKPGVPVRGRVYIPNANIAFFISSRCRLQHAQRVSVRRPRSARRPTGRPGCGRFVWTGKGHCRPGR